MNENLKIKIGEEFQPAPQFRKLYYIYLLLVLLFGILSWYLPMVIALFLFRPFYAPLVALIVAIPILLILILTVYWIPKYYRSMLYKLTENEMEWRRGVWFKKTGVVPYNRITNVDIAQGPFSRMLRIASLKIQTAGYSAPSHGTSAEIKIDGVEQFEDTRELIMEFVRGKKPIAVETYEKDEEEDINSKILSELVNMRKLLEKILKK